MGMGRVGSWASQGRGVGVIIIETIIIIIIVLTTYIANCNGNTTVVLYRNLYLRLLVIIYRWNEARQSRTERWLFVA